MAITAEELAAQLREAEAAHGDYEQELGHRDDDWPAWYATFIVGRLDQPRGICSTTRSSGSSRPPSTHI